jgi:hypothetical protein
MPSPLPAPAAAKKLQMATPPATVSRRGLTGTSADSLNPSEPCRLAPVRHLVTLTWSSEPGPDLKVNTCGISMDRIFIPFHDISHVTAAVFFSPYKEVVSVFFFFWRITLQRCNTTQHNTTQHNTTRTRFYEQTHTILTL